MRLSFVEPMVPTLVERPPAGGEWLHEVKFDGYRTQIVADGSEVRLFTRRGHDWTDRYSVLADEFRRLEAPSAIVDGEVVALDDRGLSSFGNLKKAIARRSDDLYFMGFDLLYLDGHDLRRMGTEERRHLLRQVVPETGSRIQFSQELEGDPEEAFAAIERAGIEGVVSKRREARYRSGVARDWLKAKSMAVDEFDVLGVEAEAGKPSFALMAERGTGRYVGSAFITLNRQMRERLWERVRQKSGSKPKGMKERPSTRWLRPGLVGRVRHLRGEEMLRHASLQEVREEGQPDSEG